MTQQGSLLNGRYKLDRILGRGGMAEVWRARDLRLSRDVAIKRLRVDLASDPTFQARFRKEAHSAASLNHPNIVAVYDTGEEPDENSDASIPYIVMELVEGRTLRDVLREGRKIIPQRALEFTSGVLAALAYSHRSGIVHRDIKPANVMLTKDGTVKVMDFGIARAVADTSATMTQTAAVIGTAQYLSPEQARGEKVDNRSDLYSVGCLLYELLTSEPPFQGDSPVSVAYQHVREVPEPPSKRDSEVTSEMDAITMKALAKAPADRYQSAIEMRDDVRRCLAGQPVLAQPPIADDSTQVIAPKPAAPRRGIVPPPPPEPVGASAPTVATPVVAAPQPAAPVNPPEEPPAEEEKPRNRTAVIVLSVLSVLVLIAMVVAIFFFLPKAEPEVETVPVPRVTGETETAATNAIQDAGLKPVVEQVPGSEQDRGQVVEQVPEGGTQLEVGSVVTLRISQGPDTRTIPETLVGMKSDAAVTALAEAGLKNVTLEDADPKTEPTDAEPGTVISVSPASGADIRPEEQVVLTVATGTSLVPALANLTQQEATELARQAGFTQVEVVEEESEFPEGRVFDQSPPRDTAYPRTDSILIKIALPKPSPTPTPTPEPSPTPTPTLEPTPTPATEEPTPTPTPEG